MGSSSQLSPLNATEGVLSALLGLNFKVKGTCGGGAPGKVDEGDLVEADVHWGLVDVDEAPLQGVEQSRARLVGAGDALGPGVPVWGAQGTRSVPPQRQVAEPKGTSLGSHTRGAQVLAEWTSLNYSDGDN